MRGWRISWSLVVCGLAMATIIGQSQPAAAQDAAALAAGEAKAAMLQAAADEALARRNAAQKVADDLQAKAIDFAGAKGLDTLQLTQCITGKLTAKEVEDSIAEARALQVSSTPTLFVNGRRLVGSVQWDQLKQVIDHEVAYAQKNATKKDEACCEVKLAIPGAK